MGEYELRKKKSDELMNVQLLPSFSEISLKEVEYKKYPIENISALGVATEPLVSAMKGLGGQAGTSGIYRVNTKGLEMFQSQGGYIGALQNVNGGVGGGQAVMTPLSCDPTMMFMAMALMTIEKKLDDIKALQEEMLEFMKAKEKANLRGNMNTLLDILKNYKFNCNNDKYKTNKHILVQDIRRSAEQSILLYRDLIMTMLAKKELLHSDQEISLKLKKANENFNEYQISIYLYSFSAFLEVMLLENFDKNYIASVSEKIEEHSLKYRELYTECYNEFEKNSKKTIQSFLAKGVASVSKGTGKVVEKIPLINKGKVDEFLLESSDKLQEFNDRRNDKKIQKLTVNSIKGKNPFIDSLKQIEIIYNEPIEVLMDSENLYLIEGKK